MLHILGVSRSPRFSPNSADRDAALFAAVVSRLRRWGHEVSIISEDLFVSVDLQSFDVVFSMARSRYVVDSLSEAETEGGLCVVNSARALASATRAKLMQAFEAAGVPQPAFCTLAADPAAADAVPFSFPYWLKRSEACAQTPADVVYVENREAAVEALGQFAARGVGEVVAVRHAEGDLVKFYGVAGTDFFRCSYPTAEGGFSKFGLEEHNGRPQGYAFDEAGLKLLAGRAAEASGFSVYGGDAVVRPDGTFALIDFNDWPSFSPCRREAAKAIAAAVCAAPVTQ